MAKCFVYSIELFDCDSAALDESALVKNLLTEFCSRCGLTILKTTSHRFKPQGLTTVFVLSESHIAYHSWPERGYAAIDFISCREVKKIKTHANWAQKQLSSKRVKLGSYRREF